MLKITDGKAVYEHENGELFFGELVKNPRGSFRLNPTQAFWTHWENFPMQMRTAGFWVDKEGGAWRVQIDEDSYGYAVRPAPADKVVKLRHNTEFDISMEVHETEGKDPVYVLRRHGELMFCTERVQDAVSNYDMFCHY